ncbi:MAG TPA: hypothetical protein VK487_01280, partial [Candidatus Bathyarchaeia archaeon]|nr:hypothetical protein [Candidatus Bathyarchaeia archaeon]
MVTERARTLVTHFYGCQIATTNSVKQHKLRRLIAWLSDKEGKENEFISLYVPREIPIYGIVEILRKKSASAVVRSG